MYEKNLTEDLRLRLSKKDMDFLRELAEQRCCSISEVIRSIISEYRRALESMDVLKEAIALSKKGAQLSHGDTEPDIDN